MHGIQLDWTGATGETYNVYRSIDNVNFVQIATGLSSQSDLDTTGVGGTRYYYYSTAVLGGIEGPPSNTVTAVFPTVPPAPTNMTATVV